MSTMTEEQTIETIATPIVSSRGIRPAEATFLIERRGEQELLHPALVLGINMNQSLLGTKGEPSIEAVYVNEVMLRHAGTADWHNALVRAVGIVHESHKDWQEGRTCLAYSERLQAAVDGYTVPFQHMVDLSMRIIAHGSDLEISPSAVVPSAIVLIDRMTKPHPILVFGDLPTQNAARTAAGAHLGAGEQSTAQAGNQIINNIEKMLDSDHPLPFLRPDALVRFNHPDSEVFTVKSAGQMIELKELPGEYAPELFLPCSSETEKAIDNSAPKELSVAEMREAYPPAHKEAAEATGGIAADQQTGADALDAQRTKMEHAMNARMKDLEETEAADEDKEKEKPAPEPHEPTDGAPEQPVAKEAAPAGEPVDDAAGKEQAPETV